MVRIVQPLRPELPGKLPQRDRVQIPVKPGQQHRIGRAGDQQFNQRRDLRIIAAAKIAQQQAGALPDQIRGDGGDGHIPRGGRATHERHQQRGQCRAALHHKAKSRA